MHIEPSWDTTCGIGGLAVLAVLGVLCGIYGLWVFVCLFFVDSWDHPPGWTPKWNVVLAFTLFTDGSLSSEPFSTLFGRCSGFLLRLGQRCLDRGSHVVVFLFPSHWTSRAFGTWRISGFIELFWLTQLASWYVREINATTSDLKVRTVK